MFGKAVEAGGLTGSSQLWFVGEFVGIPGTFANAPAGFGLGEFTVGSVLTKVGELMGETDMNSIADPVDDAPTGDTDAMFVATGSVGGMGVSEGPNASGDAAVGLLPARSRKACRLLLTDTLGVTKSGLTNSSIES